jgi:hypothetical protein
MKKEQFCESCGMPLKDYKDFGGGKLDNKYCVYCCDTSGKLFPYEVVLENMKNFIIKTSGISQEKALLTAKENMSKMPAWMGKSVFGKS